MGNSSSFKIKHLQLPITDLYGLYQILKNQTIYELWAFSFLLKRQEETDMMVPWLQPKAPPFYVTLKPTCPQATVPNLLYWGQANLLPSHVVIFCSVWWIPAKASRSSWKVSAVLSPSPPQRLVMLFQPLEALPPLPFSISIQYFCVTFPSFCPG